MVPRIHRICKNFWITVNQCHLASVTITAFPPCASKNRTQFSCVRWNLGLRIFFGRRNVVWIYIVVKGFCISATLTKFIHYRQ
uniref:Uncharacterized protein n=1 Tax=Arundo donax TaxID=35708 RepID=A0A0A9DGQ0_ARUDO